MYQVFSDIGFSSLGLSGMQLLGYTVTLGLIFWETAKLISIVLHGHQRGMRVPVSPLASRGSLESIILGNQNADQEK